MLISFSVTPEKKAIAEAKLNNSRARLASMWLKVGALTTPEYKQVCASYASAALSGGKEVIALPEAREKLYTATEIGAINRCKHSSTTKRQLSGLLSC